MDPALMFTSNMYLTHSLSLSLPFLCTCVGVCKSSSVCETIGNEGRSFCVLCVCKCMCEFLVCKWL